MLLNFFSLANSDVGMAAVATEKPTKENNQETTFNISIYEQFQLTIVF